MSKLINLIIAALIFGVIYYFLVPLIGGTLGHFIGIVVIVIAIVYLLGELSNYNWPWIK